MTRLSVAAVGECMVELSAVEGGLWTMSFAGDTFNTLWTMRGLLPVGSEVDYITAFGDDKFSLNQIEFLRQNSIGIAESPMVKGSSPGMYAITLDGYERSFTYWRDSSAARHLADDRQRLRISLADRDLVYFSGITLAILAEDKRDVLLEEVSRARRLGSRIAFDPNYRPRLWSGRDIAQNVTDAALQIADIVLPTFDDEVSLFGDVTPTATTSRLRTCGVAEAVIKCGRDPARYMNSGGSGTVPAEHVEAPIDTTGAGDAFNGGYLVARLQGAEVEYAVAHAHKIAALAIQTKGATIPMSILTATSLWRS